MTGTCTVRSARQRELNFTQQSRFTGRQFDLAALEAACGGIVTRYGWSQDDLAAAVAAKA